MRQIQPGDLFIEVSASPTLALVVSLEETRDVDRTALCLHCNSHGNVVLRQIGLDYLLGYFKRLEGRWTS